MTADTPAADHPHETDWSRFFAVAAALVVLISLTRARRRHVQDGRSKPKARAFRPKAVAKKNRKTKKKAKQRRPGRGGAPRGVLARRKRSSSAPGEEARKAHARR